MFRNILVKLGLAPSDEERKILLLLKQPWNKSCRVTRRGGLTKDSKDIGTSPKAIAFRKKCVQILKDYDEANK
jgi:hypothetical protein